MRMREKKRPLLRSAVMLGTSSLIRTGLPLSSRALPRSSRCRTPSMRISTTLRGAAGAGGAGAGPGTDAADDALGEALADDIPTGGLAGALDATEASGTAGVMFCACPADASRLPAATAATRTEIRRRIYMSRRLN